MRDIVLFGIKARVTSAVPDPLEFGHDLIPRCGTNVLEDNDGRAVVFDPSQHTAERATGLSVRRDVLFLIVQVRIVNTGSSSHEHIDVSWNWYLSTICGGTRVGVEKSVDDKVSGR